MCIERLTVCVSPIMSTTMPRHVKPPYVHSLMPGLFIKRRFSVSVHPISILDKMTDLQKENLGVNGKITYEQSLDLIHLRLFKRHYWLKSNLPVLKALLVQVQFACLKGMLTSSMQFLSE